MRLFSSSNCLNRGANPRAIQQVMGHKSLETTMGYLHAEAMSVASPLDDGKDLRTCYLISRKKALVVPAMGAHTCSGRIGMTWRLGRTLATGSA